MEKEIDIIQLGTAGEMLQNFHLVQQLTPALSFARYAQYLLEMIPHNYFQVVAKINGKAIGVSGYWLATKLYCGRYLEIDNFVVDEKYRSEKVGHKLLGRLEEIALQHHCDVMMLDAYLQNKQAHRFYENHGFRAKGFHFIRKVSALQIEHECLQ